MARRRLVVAAVAATVAATVALIAATPGVATAARWHGTDARGDVSASSYDPEPKPCGMFTDHDGRSETSTDITGLTVVHRKDTVHLVARFRDLRRGSDQFVLFSVKTPKRIFWVDVVRSDDGSADAMIMHAPAEPKPDPDPSACSGYAVVSSANRCPRLTGSFAPARDVVTVDIPRRCLRNPHWVQAGVSSIRSAHGVDYEDTWAPVGAKQEWSGPFGPPVRRG